MIALGQVYNPRHIQIFGHICNTLSGVNILLCIFILPVILTQTLQSMKVYKRLFVLYIFVQMGFDVWSVLFKHTILLPLNVIINVGYFQDSATPVLTNIGFNGFLTLIMMLADVLLCLFIERYYSITKTLITHGFWKQIFLYGGIILTHLALVSTSVMSFYVFGHLYADDKAEAFVRETISDPELLLSKQIPFVTDLYTEFSLSTATTAVTFFIYAITRAFGFSYYTYKNIQCLKAVQSITNPIHRKHHTVIIRTLIIQLVMMMLFFGLPAGISFCIVTLKLPYPLLYLYIQCNYHIYPICDLIVTVILIKPYRRAFIYFIFSILSLLTRTRVPSATVAMATTKMIIY